MSSSTEFELKPAKYSLATEFGMPIDPNVMIRGYEPGHPAVPPKDDGYVFQRAKLRDLLAFWESDLIGLKLYGDPGTGKTSLPEQFLARLNWPLLKVPCNPSLETHHLMGQLLPDGSGGLKWVDGPVMNAYKHGLPLMLDEGNLLDPGQAVGLNAMLEMYTIVIPETGEIVRPKKGFRVFWTENPIDSRLNMAGRNVMDDTNVDRFMNMHVDYLPKDEEVKVVFKALRAAGTDDGKAKMLAEQVVGVAQKTREAYRSGDTAIDRPMTTRAVIRWAKLVRRFQNVSPEEEGPLIYALVRSVSMNSAMAEAVKEFTRGSIGS
jgi:cobaltochelatase CobS